MKMMNKLALVLLSAATSAVTLVSGASSANAATIRAFGLTRNNQLLSFGIDDPSQVRAIDVSGVNGRLRGVDFRPANGLLYGISTTDDIYTIDTNTGAATLESMLSPRKFRGGQRSGFDFNPAADALRLEGSNDQNFRINVDNGQLADGNPDRPGVQPDGNLAYAPGDVNEGVDPTITAAAYTNSFPGQPAGRSTQLYAIDSELDILTLQNPPNDGTLNTIGSLGIDFGRFGGFDIFSPASGDNTAYAATNSIFYGIDLATGEATNFGTIGDGSYRIAGLATTQVPEPASIAALLGFGAFAFSRRRASKKDA